MTLRMTILAGSMKDQAFLLNTDSIKIGRGPGVDFELNENSVSKVHALIEVMGDQIRIQDLDSRNGVHVAGKAGVALLVEVPDRGQELGGDLFVLHGRIPPGDLSNYQGESGRGRAHDGD